MTKVEKMGLFTPNNQNTEADESNSPTPGPICTPVMARKYTYIHHEHEEELPLATRKQTYFNKKSNDINLLSQQQADLFTHLPSNVIANFRQFKHDSQAVNLALFTETENKTDTDTIVAVSDWKKNTNNPSIKAFQFNLNLPKKIKEDI